MAVTIREFFKRFPDDDACLAHLFNVRYGDEPECPSCHAQATFHKLKKVPAYACSQCGHHIHPTAGTFMHRTHVPIQDWFYAMYLFTTSRHGVAAKELERQLGVSYPTAFRMAHKIREYMGEVDGEPPLTDHVEADETYIGGKRKGTRGRGAKGKSVVFGILERNGGELYSTVLPDAKRDSIIPEIVRQVPKGTRISTDEWGAYRSLKKLGYEHDTVSHYRKEWARGDSHVNTLEAFWSALKRSIRGTHIHVSQKHLPKYLSEFEFRYNLRKSPELMFPRLLFSFPSGGTV